MIKADNFEIRVLFFLLYQIKKLNHLSSSYAFFYIKHINSLKMDFLPSFERTPLSKWSTKDVNEVYRQEAVVGVGTYG